MNAFWHIAVTVLISWVVGACLVTALFAKLKHPEPAPEPLPLPKPLEVLMEARAIVWAYERVRA
jgi:multidrug efflux pump subunit AcrB